MEPSQLDKRLKSAYDNGYKDGYLKAIEEFNIKHIFKMATTHQLVFDPNQEEKQEFLKRWNESKEDK